MDQLKRFFILATVAILAACASASESAAPKHVLIFSHSTGYRHASIEAGVAAVRAIAERNGYVVQATEDPAVFSAEGLAQIDAVVFISTTTSRRDPNSEWLVGDRRTAFQDFIHRGGGFVGIHAAADSHYNWPWYRQMIGAAFRTHPPGEPEGVVTVVDSNHPATRGLPTTVRRADEWYYYDDFDPNVRLLVTFDPVSIGQPGPGPNPISWAHEFEGGRVFYTGLGHVPASYEEDFFLRHVEGGLKWALHEEN